MACNSCTKHTPCKRHRKKSKASNWYVPNVALPPPYGVTFETTRPDAVAICKETTVSFANSNLGNGVNIGAIVGVKHRVIVKDSNDVIKLDATFTVGTAAILSDIVIGNSDMVVKWFEDEAILTIDASKILPSSGGIMQHYVFYDGVWSVNIDETEIKRWLVTFVYENPISIAGQADSVWVDDGCTIDFAALNNIDERAIETATQNGVTLTPTSGIPVNQNYTSNPITSTTTIAFTLGIFAPRYTVKNSNHIGGYVKVEWLTEVDFVPANTQRSYIIPFGTVVKTTAYIIDPATGLLNASVININFGNYLFPPRIDTVLFTGAIAVNPTFSTPVAFPNENGVEKARTSTFTMPNNNYSVEIKFKELPVQFDFDFENPICTNNTANGDTVVSLIDRKGYFPAITQNTPSLRAIKQADRLVLNASAYSGSYPATAPIIPYIPTLFFVLKQRVARSGVGIFVRGFEGSDPLYGNCRYGVSMPGDFAFLNTAYAISSTVPSFSTYNNQTHLLFQRRKTEVQTPFAKIRIGGAWVTHSNIIYDGMGFNTRIDIGNSIVDWDFYRMLGFSAANPLTGNEEVVLQNKVMTKYSIA